MGRLTVGLDIGTSAVRAAELDTSKSTPVLMTYGQVGLPPGSLVDGEIRDMTAVSEAIEKLWKNGQFSGSSVIVGIAGLRAITREIDLPYVPDDEVDSAVRFQSEEVIPFPPDQTILSSQVLHDYTNSEGVKLRRVLVAAAHVDLVNGVIEVVERAGLTVDGVDLISSALVRAVGSPGTVTGRSGHFGLHATGVKETRGAKFAAWSKDLKLPTLSTKSKKAEAAVGSPSPVASDSTGGAVGTLVVERPDESAVTDRPEAIVSIGAGLTVVVIHQSGRPQFVRTIGSGGNATTAAISAALDIPIIDAETIKYRFGEDIPQIQAAERIAQPSMLELVDEIRNSIQYFASLPDRLPVSQILVTGGGSELHGLLPMLEAQVRIPVRTGLPLERVDVSKLGLSAEQAAEVAPVLGSPIGLALPEPDKAVKKFNLLPEEIAQKARMRRIQHRTLVGSIVVLALLMVFGGWKFLQVHNAQSNVDELQANIATLNAQVPKYDLVVAANDAYTKGITRRASVLNAAVDWPLALSNLITITPADASVQSFDGSALSASGTTAPATAGAATSGAATGTHSAAIGTINLNVTGPGPSLSISEAWINAVSGSQFFANPLQGATTVNPDSTISFPFTISVTPNASLSKNASLK
jgi:Tfp pilus assembly PilM family ATPase